MKFRLLLASGICLAAFAAVSVPADAKTMKECAAQWQEMKAANQTNGMKYRDFSKQCMSEGAPPAAAPPPPVEKPAATEEKKPVSGGRQAMIARERACGAEWREAKAAGRIQPGQKWPQYWSECNKRKKAEGM
jgi:protein-disulfide isomerase